MSTRFSRAVGGRMVEFGSDVVKAFRRSRNGREIDSETGGEISNAIWEQDEVCTGCLGFGLPYGMKT